MSRLSELKRPILCYVTDRRSLPGAPSSDHVPLLLETIDAAMRAGVDWIQIREKDLSARDLIALVRAALDCARGAAAATRIFVNGRMDIALATGADGVHLSESGLPVSEACRLREEFFSRGPQPRDFLIGASCHSLESAVAAARSGADYIYFGPVFDTPSKRAYGPPQGLDRLAEACRAVAIPVLGIGGITLLNAPECFAAGAAGIAAIRLFQERSSLVSGLSHLRMSGRKRPQTREGDTSRY